MDEHLMAAEQQALVTAVVDGLNTATRPPPPSGTVTGTQQTQQLPQQPCGDSHRRLPPHRETKHFKALRPNGISERVLVQQRSRPLSASVICVCSDCSTSPS